MSETSKKVLQSFLKNEPRNIRNDASREVEGSCALFLHGHKIASIGYDGKTVYASLAGWPTVTTRDRLTALCRALDRTEGVYSGVYQRKHRQYHGSWSVGKTIHQEELGMVEFFVVGQLPEELWQEPRAHYQRAVETHKRNAAQPRPIR